MASPTDPFAALPPELARLMPPQLQNFIQWLVTNPGFHGAGLSAFPLDSFRNWLTNNPALMQGLGVAGGAPAPAMPTQPSQSTLGFSDLPAPQGPSENIDALRQSLLQQAQAQGGMPLPGTPPLTRAWNTPAPPAPLPTGGELLNPLTRGAGGLMSGMPSYRRP